VTLEWLDQDDGDEPTYAGRLFRGSVACGLTWLGRQEDGAPADDGTIGFVASTAAVDRMGDSIDQQTWKLAAFRRNPVFLGDHDARSVVGRVVRVGRVKGEESQDLRIRVRFDDDATVNPRGALLAHQHRNGFRSAVSVGFIPHEATNRTKLSHDDPLYVDEAKTPAWRAGYLFRHNELLEVSSVGVPANAEALQLAADVAAAEASDAAVQRAVREVAPKVDADAIIAALRDARVRAAVVAIILSVKPPKPDEGAPPAAARGLVFPFPSDLPHTPEAGGLSFLRSK
jgi:hypothetical protein